MSIYEIGRVCIKIAGRDASKKCVVIGKEGENFVLVDGETRRRKVNVKHLEPMGLTVEVNEGADTAAVAKALGIEIKAKKSKTPGERPKKVRKAKAKPVKEKAPAKKEKPVKEKKAAKEEPKAEEKTSHETELEKAVAETQEK